MTMTTLTTTRGNTYLLLFFMKFFCVFHPVSHHRIVIVDQLRSPKGLRKNSERTPKDLRCKQL